MRTAGLAIVVVGILSLIVGANAALADDLSIYDIQTNTSDGDASIYDGEIHNVTGGVVTHIWQGFNHRVYLQDPAHPTFGAIVVKDAEGGELSTAVSLGDWVSFTDIYIEEYRGTTFLQYRRSFAPDVAFAIESSGHPVPAPIVLPAADIPVPVDHAASEPYESMVLQIQNVTVGQKDLGKAGDNYELIQGAELAWGTDYMNVDAGAPYDPRITTGALLESVTGVLEQYTKLSDGWDYYQLVTRFAADIVPAPPLSIYEIQYTTDPSGDSPHNGEIRDVTGGIVTHIWQGFNHRVYLQDPAHPTFGAIVVKDAEGGELSTAVSLGDWVSFTDIYIEEYRGTTFLQYRRSFAPDVAFTIESSGHLVPAPIVLTAAQMAYPVANHLATEPYESMMVTLYDVIVGQKNLGKADDNYELGQDGHVVWGTDYMNIDAGAPYDSRIVEGAWLASITGAVEQYTKTSDGWDYYQLVTRSADDIVSYDAIPTVSEWGLIILALTLLTAGKVVFRPAATART